MDKAYKALAAARELKALQPVAWWNPTTDNASTDPYYRNSKECKPLYAAPPRKKWVGLTEKEIFEADNAGQGLIEFARAIETKLKGRNT